MNTIHNFILELQKKRKVKQTFYLSEELLMQFKKICEKLNVPQSKIIERLMEKFLHKK